MVDRRPLAVIGAGFSGTMTALHLLRRVPDRRILLCEGARFARGAAYSTPDPLHLLNVRAANMSAFPDRPDHFSEWLAGQRLGESPGVHETEVGTFVSRGLFGRYLASLVSEALGGGDGAARLRIVPEKVMNLVPEQGGYCLTLDGGRRHQVAGAVLAIGNLLPENGPGGAYVENPWATRFADGLVDGLPVVVLGTGLTMVDVVSRLWASGFPGPVIAISRRGLLPHVHALTVPWPAPVFSDAERRSLARLLRRVRQETRAARSQGVGWQSVIDSLRPQTAALWQELPAAEQRRFLRHLRPWWDTHRHRMAPPIGQQILGLIDQGYLQIRAGRVEPPDTEGTSSVVTYRPRGGTEPVRIAAQRIINATGTAPASAIGNPLLLQLREQGLVRLDSHRIGIDATARLEVVGKTGSVTPRLWALGPIVRGVFWECTAVPDIRAQAARLADHIAASLTTLEPALAD